MAKTTISDGDQQREERRDRHHEEVDGVDLRRLLGRLAREERKAFEDSVNIVRFGARGTAIPGLC